ERRVGNDPAIPIIFAIDLGGWKAGRQRAAGDDMRRGNPVGGRVERDEVPGPHVDRADAQARSADLDAIEIDEALERGPQRRYLVVADRVRTADSPWHRRRKSGCEEIRGAEQQDAERTGLVEQRMDRLVRDGYGRKIWKAQRRRADGFPELS